MKTFYVTFGTNYNSSNPHPKVPHATGDTVVKILAGSYQKARAIAFHCIGDKRAFLYPESAFTKSGEHYVTYEPFTYEITHTFDASDVTSKEIVFDYYKSQIQEFTARDPETISIKFRGGDNETKRLSVNDESIDTFIEYLSSLK